MRFGNLVLCLGASASITTAAHAALLVYEPFDYGSTDVLLSGVSGTALGLDGSTYSTGSAATLGAPGSVNYYDDGLDFSNLSVTGGRAHIIYDTTIRNATRGLDASLSSGTLYGSFLYVCGGGTNNGISDLLFGASNATDNTGKIVVAANEYDGSSTSDGPNYMGARISGTGVKATGTQMAEDGTTYLVLFQLSNIGATSGSQTLDAWALTEAQFDTFKAGGLTSAELNAATLGATATDVLQRTSVTKSAATYASFLDTDSMRLYSLRTNGQFDEIRIGSASLDEVTPVPEPASIAALGLASMLMFRRQRRR